MFIIVYGNLIDGHTFVGPFKNKDTAIKWAENEGLDADWWLADLKEVV